MNPINCIIRCNSEETLIKAKEFVLQIIGLDEIISKTVISVPGGKEILKSRLGDYFNSIELLPDESTSFIISFNRKESTDSFWKDLVVSTLMRIVDSVSGTKGNVIPRKV